MNRSTLTWLTPISSVKSFLFPTSVSTSSPRYSRCTLKSALLYLSCVSLFRRLRLSACQWTSFVMPTFPPSRRLPRLSLPFCCHFQRKTIAGRSKKSSLLMMMTWRLRRCEAIPIHHDTLFVFPLPRHPTGNHYHRHPISSPTNVLHSLTSRNRLNFGNTFPKQHSNMSTTNVLPMFISKALLCLPTIPHRPHMLNNS